MKRPAFNEDLTMVVLALVIYGLAGRFLIWLADKLGELSTLFFP